MGKSTPGPGPSWGPGLNGHLGNLVCPGANKNMLQVCTDALGAWVHCLIEQSVALSSGLSGPYSPQPASAPHVGILEGWKEMGVIHEGCWT